MQKWVGACRPRTIIPRSSHIPKRDQNFTNQSRTLVPIRAAPILVANQLMKKSRVLCECV